MLDCLQILRVAEGSEWTEQFAEASTIKAKKKKVNFLANIKNVFVAKNFKHLTNAKIYPAFKATCHKCKKIIGAL